MQTPQSLQGKVSFFMTTPKCPDTKIVSFDHKTGILGTPTTSNKQKSVNNTNHCIFCVNDVLAMEGVV